MQGVCRHAAVVAGSALQKLYAVYAEINLAYVSLKALLRFYMSI
jgi:hypothetical protein